MDKSTSLTYRRELDKSLIFSEKKYAQGRECFQAFKMAMLNWIPKTGKLYFLDIGCGTGEMSAHFAAYGHKVFGVDISSNAIKKYNSRGFPGIIADLEKGIPFSEPTFDIIWCSEVIEHIKYPEKLLSECFRVLKPGGKLLLSTPNSNYFAYRILRFLGMPWDKIQHPSHIHFFNYSSILKMINSAGFKDIYCSGYNVYFIIPDWIVIKLSSMVQSKIDITKILNYVGFKLEEGLIRSRKWILSHSNKCGNDMFSTNIMVNATK